MRRFKNILCVVESENTCRRAIERSASLAMNNQARVTVATVIERIPEGVRLPEDGPTAGDLQAGSRDATGQWLESLIEPYHAQIEISSRVLVGTSFLEIIREVLRNDYDLVIKCPESQDWMDQFFAGDDMHLLRKCPRPVWLVKPEAHESYQRILAAVDVDDNYPEEELQTRQALNSLILEMAGALAVSEFAELHVAHAWKAIGESAMRHGAFIRQPEEKVDAYVEQERQHHAQLLENLMHEVRGKLGVDAMNYVKPELHLLKGTALKEIPALAKRLDVDCIVMGTVARTGIRGFVMGNTAETILRQIDCSVLAIKPPGFVTPISLED